MKVLMLGWEYPPHVSGGLGMATAGLAEALGEMVDLQLVLPHETLSNLKQHKPLRFSKTDQTKGHIQSRDVEMVNAFDAYSSYEHIQPDLQKISKKVKKEAERIRQRSGRNTKNHLYGRALMEKVEDYATAASKIAKQSDFDIIHAHDWMTFPAAIKIKKASGKPLVIHIHSLETDRTTNPNVRNPIFKIEKQAIAKADLVIPVSNYTKESIEKHYVQSTEKFTPIHNGISTFEKAEFKVDRESKPTKSVTPYHHTITTTSKKGKKKQKKKKRDVHNVLFVGRLTAQKGVETFIRTAAKLLENRENLRFTVAGLGDQLEEMMQLVEDTEIEEYIDFKGFVQQHELKSLLEDADLLFMPSVSEPFGLAALEAAQFGLPIVISSQSGVIEVLPGVLTAEYWDSKNFARHIKVLLDYKSIRKAFGKANRKAVKKRSWRKVARKVMKAYKNLADSNNP